jgi:hypothetical protein
MEILMKKLLPLILLSLAATVSGTAGAAVAGPSAQPDGAPDYSKYVTCRENGGYTVELDDDTTKCIQFETAK